MNSDKMMRLMMGLFIFVGVVGLTVGKYILGGILIAVGIGIRVTTGGGTYNDRNLYDKTLANSRDMTVMQIYDLLKDTGTPFGKCWIGKQNSIEGDAVIFGPGPFKDYIAIGLQDDDIILKSSTELSHLKYDDEDAWRFDGLIDTENTPVNPRSYSSFASYKVVCAAMMDDLVEILNDVSEGTGTVPDELDVFDLFYVNNTDPIYRDLEGSEYASVEGVYEPVHIVVKNMDGEVVSEVKANGTKESDGYDVTVSGELYGTLMRQNASEHDEFYMDTRDGRIAIRGFRAVRKGNLSCNYRVLVNEQCKAVIAGSARIRFDEDRNTENSIVCSYDDEDLLLYITLQEFIMKKNRWLK